MLVYWVWLAQLTGISAKRKLALLREYVNPKELYDSGKQAILTLEDATSKEIAAFEERTLTKARSVVEQCQRLGIGILPATSAIYPQNLLKIPDPPVILYFKGQIPRWDTFPAVGIVGTRKASAYGLKYARDMGGQIGACGGLVISGGALGIDAAAMEGALLQGYPSVGILGCGVDVLYPQANRPLFDMLIQNGCVMSEFAPGTPAFPGNLARRNRIISGISDAVLVVEAPEKSGALITANYAAGQNRDLFVIPGNLDNPCCAGSNALLKKGARVALEGYDIVGLYKDRFPNRVRRAQAAGSAPAPKQEKAEPAPKQEKAEPAPEQAEPVESLTGDTKLVYDALTDKPMTVSQIIAKTGLPASSVQVAITMLTIAKRINLLPGRHFTKR